MFLPKPDSEAYLPCPEGDHTGVCYRFIDLGTQAFQHPGQIKHQRKVMISWELPHTIIPIGEHAGRPYALHQQYTWSMHEKATLRKHLECWRGVPFRESDFGEGGCDVRDLLGKACTLSVVRCQKAGRPSARLNHIRRPAKGSSLPNGTVNEPVYFSLEDKHFDFLAFGKLSPHVQTMIRQSPEWQKLVRLPTVRGESHSSMAFTAITHR